MFMSGGRFCFGDEKWRKLKFHPLTFLFFPFLCCILQLMSSSLIFFSLSSHWKVLPLLLLRVEKKKKKSHRCFISPVSDVIFWGEKVSGPFLEGSDVSRWRKNHKKLAKAFDKILANDVAHGSRISTLASAAEKIWDVATPIWSRFLDHRRRFEYVCNLLHQLTFAVGSSLFSSPFFFPRYFSFDQ